MTTTATVEDIQKAFEESPENARSIARQVGGNAQQFDEKRVKTWLDTMKKDHLSHSLGKGTRPWEIVNLTARLDPKQPWFGIEYETGYRSKTQYEKVINYVWQNHPFTAIDDEGCGGYPCEITFSPVNMDTFMSDEYHMDALINWQNANEAPKASHGAQEGVGTHLNVSTPAYRALQNTNVEDSISAVLNASYTNMTNKQKRTIYGRVPYTGIYSQRLGKNRWIEVKLYNSTGDIEKWRAYKPSMVRFAEIIEHLAKHHKAMVFQRNKATKAKLTKDLFYDWSWNDEVERLYISNFAAYLMGEARELEYAYR